MMALLKSFAAPPEKPSAKAKPKAKPAASVPKQQRPTQATGNAKRVRVAPDPQAYAGVPQAVSKTAKVEATETKQPKGKKRKADACPFDEELGSPAFQGELSDADKQILDGFTTKLDECKDLKPPLADSGFKANLQELTTKLNGVKADLKTKKRSACRRALRSEDPLFLALDVVEQSVARLLQLVRCNLPHVRTARIWDFG